MKKWLIGAFLAGLVTMCLLAYFNIFSCAGCSAHDMWAGNCTDALAQTIQDECCIDVRMCGGIVDNPSLCYTEYCTATGEHCVPVEFYDIGVLKYECKCESVYA